MKIERTLKGEFRAGDLGGGAWRLTSGGSAVHIVGAEAGAAQGLEGTTASEVRVAWSGGGVSVAWLSARGRREFKARAAMIHEPLASLYQALPLATLDDGARRFWRRVFFLVRIPGGRMLLGLAARRAGASR